MNPEIQEILLPVSFVYRGLGVECISIFFRIFSSELKNLRVIFVLQSLAFPFIIIGFHIAGVVHVILVHRIKSNISVFDGVQKIDATILSRPLDENVHVGVVSLWCSDSAGSSVQNADVTLVSAIGWVAKRPVSLVRFWISISVPVDDGVGDAHSHFYAGCAAFLYLRGGLSAHFGLFPLYITARTSVRLRHIAVVRLDA